MNDIGCTGTKVLILLSCITLVGYMLHKKDNEVKQIKQIQSEEISKEGVYIHASSDYNTERWKQRRINDDKYKSESRITRVCY